MYPFKKFLKKLPLNDTNGFYVFYLRLQISNVSFKLRTPMEFFATQVTPFVPLIFQNGANSCNMAYFE